MAPYSATNANNTHYTRVFKFTFKIGKIWEFAGAATANPINAPGMVFLKLGSSGYFNPPAGGYILNNKVSATLLFRDL
jgi:hypothetical protein